MTFTKTIVTRDELMFMFSLENVFVTRWSGEAAEKAYIEAQKSRRDAIPPLPHIDGLGKGARYHVATVEKWLLKHFQKGGETAKP